MFVIDDQTNYTYIYLSTIVERPCEKSYDIFSHLRMRRMSGKHFNIPNVQVQCCVL